MGTRTRTTPPASRLPKIQGESVFRYKLTPNSDDALPVAHVAPDRVATVAVDGGNRDC